MKKEEKIETLRQLGLTFNQSRAYLALLQTSPATAKEITEISKIARSDTYTVLSALEKQGMIEKVMTDPTSFQAIPMENVVPILLKRKVAEQNELSKKTKEFLDDFQKNKLTRLGLGTETIKGAFIIVPKKIAIIQKLKKAIAQAEISVCTVTSQKRFSAAIVEFGPEYRAALKRGVKITICTEKQNISKDAIKVLDSLSATSCNFQVRYFTNSPEAIVSIFDGKEASVTESVKANLAGASALWSNNPCFVALAQSYFERKWNET